MQQMPIRERNQWDSRIEELTDRLIHSLVRETDPEYMIRLRRLAVEKARNVLGLDELFNQQEAIDAQIDRLRQERDKIDIQMHQLTERLMLSTPAHLPRYIRFERVIDRQARLIEDDLLPLDSLGQQVLAVRKRTESLLDGLWLARSHGQVEAIRQEIAAFLSEHDLTPATEHEAVNGALSV
jgi:hypothetical protein